MPGLQEEEMGMTMTEKEEAKQRKKMKALSEDRDADGSGSGDEKRKKKRKKRDDDGATANGYSNKYRREEAEGDSSGKVKSRRRDDDVIEEEGRRNKKPVDESEPFGSEGRWKPEEDVMLNGRRRHYEDGSLEEGEAGIKRWGDPEPSDEGEEEEEEEESDPLDIKNFRLSKPVRDALEKKGIKALFPIQAQTFDYCLDGFDVVGRAKTGQGKTLAFVLPIIESLSRPGANVFPGRKLPSVLVLAPTRELAKQVHADFEMFARTMGLSTVCVYGGASFTPQCDAMRRGVDIVVGTPGRIKDHLNRGVLNLTRLKFRVLDEADEMLNMGFVEDVELILGAVGDAQNVQTLLFSATMPKWVQQIAARFLKPERKMVDLVENQVLKASNTVRHLLLACNAAQVEGVIGDVIQCYSKGEGRTIVFTETKNAATELVSRLRNVSAKALHGDIVQAQREVTLAGFRSGKFKVLVATDVAARGLDIANVELVIQLEPPRDVESYIHRSGRTGRAGKTGISLLICQPGRRSRVAMIERAAGVRFERITPPSSADLAQVSTAGAVEAIKAVPERAVSYFKEAAESLIKEDGAVESLAKALAKIAGHRAALSRSVLTFLQDGVTLHFHSETEIYSPGYVWTCLRRVLSEDVVNEVKGLTLTMDRKGAVFDVPTKFAEQFTSFTDSRGGVWVEVTDSLPELQMDRETTGRGGRGGGMRFGGGGGGGYGRPGGRGGGRGFGSSGGRRSSGSGGRYYGGSRR